MSTILYSYNYSTYQQRYRPHMLMAISDDPLDNIIRKQELPSKTLSGVSLKEKLALVASAREFVRDYDLNVVPNFIDDLVSTIISSYVIDGTHRAHLEQIEMSSE